MQKNIVICSDGTGNTAIKGRGTNVFKLYEAIDLHGHRNNPRLIPQVAFYDDGVGTESLKPLRVLGGAFGWGLSRNVKQLYAVLARMYNPGDRIFLFGFSRGAFTVRTLAGIIARFGVLDRIKFKSNTELAEGVERTYREYRRRYYTFFGKHLRHAYNEAWTNEHRRQFAVLDDKHAPDGKINIEFVGVWDTVDAVGLPFDHLADFINLFIYPFKFPSRKLSPQVKRACHAISIDDERHTFHPVMWDEEGKTDGRITQIWFPGVHSNVGGGYPKHGMSIVSLYWMMTEAEKVGLRFITDDREFYRNHQNVNDKLYDSRSGISVYYRYKPRDIAEISSQYNTTPKIHISVIERIAHGTEDYTPGNIPKTSEIIVTEPKPEDTIPQLVSQAIDAALGGSSSLLDRVRLWTFVRRSSHYAFLGLSLIAVCLTFYAEASRVGIFNLLGGLFSMDGLIRFGITMLRKPLIPAVPIIFYLIGLLASNKMKRVFSRFWYELVPELRKILR